MLGRYQIVEFFPFWNFIIDRKVSSGLYIDPPCRGNDMPNAVILGPWCALCNASFLLFLWAWCSFCCHCLGQLLARLLVAFRWWIGVFTRPFMDCCMQEIISNIFQCMNSASHSTFSALRHRVFCTKSGCFQPAFTQKLKRKVPSRFQKSHAEISRRIYIWVVLSIMLSEGGTVMSLFEYVKIWGIFGN